MLLLPLSQWWRIWCQNCTRIHNQDHAQQLPVKNQNAKPNTERQFARLHHNTVSTMLPSNTYTTKPLKPCGVVQDTTSPIFLCKDMGTTVASKFLVQELPVMLPGELRIPHGLRKTASPLRMANALKDSRDILPVKRPKKEKPRSRSSWSDKFLPARNFDSR